MSYIGTPPKDVRSFGKAQFDFTATQGQTVFTGSDDDSKTLGFTEGQIQVHVNGVLLDGSDYSTSNNNTVTLSAAANANDVLTVLALQTDIPNSDYVPISGGTFSGDVTVSGSFTSQGIDDNATSTAMTLDGSGNVLVGTTTVGIASGTEEGLNILGQYGAFEASRSNNASLYLNRTTSDGPIAVFRKDGSTVGSVATWSGDPAFMAAQNWGLKLYDSTSIDDIVHPIDTSGSTYDNQVSLGYSASRFKDLYLSGGVYLGGTGSANKLDDVEEGNWTPVMGSVTHTNSGKYAKIGSLVFLSIGDRSASAVPDGGSMTITGLPFTVAGWEWTGSLAVTWGDASNGYQYRVATGRQVPNNTLIVYNRGGVGTTTSDPWNISVVYRTNA